MQPPMTTSSTRHDDADLKAIFAYLRTDQASGTLSTGLTPGVAKVAGFKAPSSFDSDAAPSSLLSSLKTGRELAYRTLGIGRVGGLRTKPTPSAGFER